MCGRFSALTIDEVMDVIEEVEAKAAGRESAALSWPEASALEHVRPGGEAACIVAGEEGLRPQLLTWGFDVSWSRSLVFNTRIERAIKGSGMWTNSLATGRCIVPARAFFEPHHTETQISPKTGRPVKAQYQFSAADSRYLLMAGVAQEGRFSVVTCEPDRVVSSIHDRSPMLLSAKSALLWMSDDYEQAIGAHAGRLIADLEEQEGMQLGLF